MDQKTQKALLQFAKEHKVLTAIIVVLLLIGIGAYLIWGNGGSGTNGTDDGDDLNVMTATPTEEQATPTDAVTPSKEPEATPTDKEEPTEAVKPTDTPAPTATSKPTDTPKPTATSTPTPAQKQYTFRNKSTRDSHFEKHGQEFPYATVEDYVAGANRVINSKDALHKIEKEDGDDIYYLEASNEFVVVSTDGYIRTYFKPSGGKKYYDRQ